MKGKGQVEARGITLKGTTNDKSEDRQILKEKVRVVRTDKGTFVTYTQCLRSLWIHLSQKRMFIPCSERLRVEVKVRSYDNETRCPALETFLVSSVPAIVHLFGGQVVSLIL